jgi:phosphohistidine phosphatase
MILLIHHGDAVMPDVDPMRPLSDRGRAATQLLAYEMHRRGIKPDCVWHSGKLRARQTAEIVWRACNPLATLSAERGLQPTDPPEWMRDRLAGEPREVIAVGHLPNIARLLRVLVADDADAVAIGFPLNGVVAVEARVEPGQHLGGWVERWRLDPRQLSGT